MYHVYHASDFTDYDLCTKFAVWYQPNIYLGYFRWSEQLLNFFSWPNFSHAGSGATLHLYFMSVFFRKCLQKTKFVAFFRWKLNSHIISIEYTDLSPVAMLRHCSQTKQIFYVCFLSKVSAGEKIWFFFFFFNWSENYFTSTQHSDTKYILSFFFLMAFAGWNYEACLFFKVELTYNSTNVVTFVM